MKQTLVVVSLLLFSKPVFAQKKLELDDVNIKGELLNDQRMRLLSRERNSLKNYVKFRTNYRKEIIEGMPKPMPKIKY